MKSLIERLLLTLEVAEPATVKASATTTATTSSTATTKATTSSATAAPSTTIAEASTTTSTVATTTTAEATSATATSTVVFASGSVVNANVTALDLLAVQGLERGGSLILGAKVDVTKAFDGTSIAVSGQRYAGDVAVLGENLLDAFVRAVKGQVAKEQGVARRATLVTILAGTIVGLASIRLLTGSAEIDIQLATIKLILVHLSLSLGSIGSISKFDVTESEAISKEKLKHVM